jgi:hypothetical protein
MAIFGRPDFRRLRHDRDWPRIIYWALNDKDVESRRAALAVLRADAPVVVEYLYDTAEWAQANSVGRRKRLPSRGVKLLDEAARGLTRVGRRAVPPLVAAVRVYDEFGSPEEDTRVLFLALSFDILERIGAPAVAGLRELEGDPHDDVVAQAREALAKLEARGLVDDDA